MTKKLLQQMKIFVFCSLYICINGDDPMWLPSRIFDEYEKCLKTYRKVGILKSPKHKKWQTHHHSTASFVSFSTEINHRTAENRIKEREKKTSDGETWLQQIACITTNKNIRFGLTVSCKI